MNGIESLERIVVDAIHTGVRNNLDWGYYRELVLLYDDGSWEKIFRSSADCNISRIKTQHLRGLTRSQVVEKLEVLYYDDKLKGRFLDVR